MSFFFRIRNIKFVLKTHPAVVSSKLCRFHKIKILGNFKVSNFAYTNRCKLYLISDFYSGKESPDRKCWEGIKESFGKKIFSLYNFILIYLQYINIIHVKH